MKSTTDEWHANATWSPDGAWIAFVRQLAEGGQDPTCKTPPEDEEARVESPVPR